MSALRTITLSLLLPLLLGTSAAQAAEQDNGDASGVLQRISSFTDRATSLAIEAMSLVGIHYRRGGNSPEHGLDCSGLVRYVFKQSNDIDLPRTSVEMSRVGEQIDKKTSSPAISFSSTRCAERSLTSVSTSATINSYTRQHRVARFALKAWI